MNRPRTLTLCCLLLALLLALGAQGADVKDLIARLASDDVDDARSAAKALGKLGGDAGGAIGPLFDAITDGAPRVKLEALKALKDVGSASRGDFVRALLERPKISDKLTELADDSGPLVKRAVEELTGASAGALRDHLKDATDKDERKGVIERLGDLGGDDEETLATLKEAAGDADDGVRAAAEKALEKIKNRGS